MVAASLQISSCNKSDVQQAWYNLVLWEFDTIVGNVHQAGKIHNLHQVSGVFGCVRHKYIYVSPYKLGSAKKFLFVFWELIRKSSRWPSIIKPLRW
jgi:hypothetical protein